jgi:hypothetical protein
MLNFLRNIDSWIIERILEPITWRIEYRFGKNNFWLARLSAAFDFFAVLFASIMYSTFGVPISWPTIAMFFVIDTTIYIGAFYLERLSGKRINPMRWGIGLVAFRLFVLSYDLYTAWSSHGRRFVSIVFLGPEYYGILIPLGLLIYSALSSAIFLYLVACSGMPPVWKQARDEKHAEKLVPQLT